ncbi:MAG TPA: tetratricopeptide repeat protein [Chthonomonadales bacterium]|nr:tetratricopeptide repeat protein [Chthonomonadales bacterium]
MHRSALRNESLRQLESDARANPNDAQTQYYLGRAALLAQQFDEAKDAYAEAVRLNPEWAQAHTGLAIALYGAGQANSAFLEADNAIRLGDDSGGPEFLQARVDWQQKNVRDAVDQAARATQLAPQTAGYWFVLGRYYLSLQRATDAAAALRKAVHLNPSNTDYATLLGGILLQAGQPDEARGYLESVVKRDPNATKARILLAEYYINSSSAPDALSRAESLLAGGGVISAAETGQAAYDLGQVYLKEGKPVQARDAFLTAQKAEYNPEQVSFALASAYEALGDHKRAAGARTRFAALSQRRLAIGDLIRRAAASPDDPSIVLQIAQSYRDIGQTMLAEQAYAAYLQRNPRDTAAIKEHALLADKARVLASEEAADPLPAPPQ